MSKKRKKVIVVSRSCYRAFEDDCAAWLEEGYEISSTSCSYTRTIFKGEPLYQAIFIDVQIKINFSTTPILDPNKVKE